MSPERKEEKQMGGSRLSSDHSAIKFLGRTIELLYSNMYATQLDTNLKDLKNPPNQTHIERILFAFHHHRQSLAPFVAPATSGATFQGIAGYKNLTENFLEKRKLLHKHMLTTLEYPTFSLLN